MSDYGKLWERVRVIRERLQKMIPSASVDSLGHARAQAKSHAVEVEHLLREWQDIESQMEKTP
jgi:hypothetical protein